MAKSDGQRVLFEVIVKGWGPRAAAAGLSALLASCGGGGSPVAPPPPTLPPAEQFSVTAVLFYDVNRNNVLDSDEVVRLADVDVQVAGRSGRTERTGRVVVQGVPRGTHQIVVQSTSLPPFYVPGAAVFLEVPQTGAEAPVPVGLPIGTNRPFFYLCSGDSISQGTGSTDGRGYRTRLQSKLEPFLGHSIITTYRGGGGGTTEDGAQRIVRDLEINEPAYTLIEWGTNDWNFCGDPATCFTIPSLRSLVRDVKAAGSLPCLATIIPPNVGFDDRAPASRAAWVSQADDQIRALARAEGALLVDLQAAFVRQPNLSALFIDHVHPNDAGHEIIATTFFEALTRPRGTSAVGADFSDPLPLFVFHRPGKTVPGAAGRGVGPERPRRR